MTSVLENIVPDEGKKRIVGPKGLPARKHPAAFVLTSTMVWLVRQGAGMVSQTRFCRMRPRLPGVGA
jgi:hypothetical protein